VWEGRNQDVLDQNTGGRLGSPAKNGEKKKGVPLSRGKGERAALGYEQKRMARQASRMAIPAMKRGLTSAVSRIGKGKLRREK